MATTKKPKTSPLETRLRQILTEVLRDLEDEEEFDAKDRALIVDEVMGEYSNSILDNMAGLLALTIRGLDSDSEEPEEAEADEKNA